MHWYIRASNGQITTFDVPAAGTFSQRLIGFNNVGQISGQADGSFGSIYFIRNSGGQVTYLSEPAGFRGIDPVAINDAGQVTGISGHRWDSGSGETTVHGRSCQSPPRWTS